MTTIAFDQSKANRRNSFRITPNQPIALVNIEESNPENNVKKKDRLAVTVSSLSIDQITQNDIFYNLNFSYGIEHKLHKWEVKRSYSSILNLSTDLIKFSQINLNDSFPNIPNNESKADKTKIEKYLQDLLDLYDDNLWNSQHLLRFLDDNAFASVTSFIRLNRLSEQIKFLETKNEEINKKQVQTETLTLAVYEIMRVLQRRMSDMEHVFLKKDISQDAYEDILKNGTAPLADLLQKAQEIEKALIKPDVGELLKTLGVPENNRTRVDSNESNAYSSISLRTTNDTEVTSWPTRAALSPISSPIRRDEDKKKFVKNNIILESSSQLTDIEKKSNETETPMSLSPRNTEVNIRLSVNQNIRNDHIDYDTELSALASSLAIAPSNTNSSRFSGISASFWDTGNIEESDRITQDSFSQSLLHRNSSNSDMIKANESINSMEIKLDNDPLPIDMIPQNELTSQCDYIVDEIISIVRPHDPQIAYRSSAKAFLSKHIRRALGSKVFETGLHSIRCFLPDDPIRLSVILWKNNSGHWHTHLSDRLCRLSETGKIMEDDIIDANYDDIPSHLDHTVCNVSYTNNNTLDGDFRIFCMIDSLGVEISSNNRTDLCLLSFFEEISNLIGKNNLFKKSLLLIRSWWVYETASYIGCPMKHYMTDYSLVILVVAIFNKHHHKIYFPLQALCIFLAEFSKVDFTNSIVSIFGILSFKIDSNVPNMLEPEPNDLIQIQLLDKYWDIFNLPNELVPQEQKDSNITEVTDSAVDRTVEITTVPNDNLTTELNSESTSIERMALLRNNALLLFEKRAVNIIHPLNYSNMISDKINIRRAKRINKVFFIGASNMNSVLKLSTTIGSVSVQTAFNNFFRNVITRFATGWRPDVIGNTIWIRSGPRDNNEINTPNWSETWCEPTLTNRPGDDNIKDIDSDTSDYSKDILRVSLDRLWDEILYCSLILEGCITDTALLMLTKEILMERGTLPVGEIGKMLQELTSMSTLSSKLKEKFGGLKKFLERFSEHFLIGTDHPFNPHVFLRQTLTQEDLEIISRGSVPPQLLAKFKKLVVVRKKKSVPPAPTTSNLEYGPWGRFQQPSPLQQNNQYPNQTTNSRPNSLNNKIIENTNSSNNGLFLSDIMKPNYNIDNNISINQIIASQSTNGSSSPHYNNISNTSNRSPAILRESSHLSFPTRASNNTNSVLITDILTQSSTDLNSLRAQQLGNLESIRNDSYTNTNSINNNSNDWNNSIRPLPSPGNRSSMNVPQRIQQSMQLQQSNQYNSQYDMPQYRNSNNMNNNPYYYNQSNNNNGNYNGLSNNPTNNLSNSSIINNNSSSNMSNNHYNLSNNQLLPNNNYNNNVNQYSNNQPYHY